jgi:type IV pilus biogenesis protein PilP
LSIPSSASVARQATIENAIPLNKINLVGVYGVPSDRRALVRLPSGRYVKVKVGDQVDGGTVAQINDSELIYRKGSRTVALSMPKG